MQALFAVFGELPPPAGTPSSRGRVLFIFIPPLEEEVDSTVHQAVEDGGVLPFVEICSLQNQPAHLRDYHQRFSLSPQVNSVLSHLSVQYHKS